MILQGNNIFGILNAVFEMKFFIKIKSTKNIFLNDLAHFHKG